MSDISVLQDLSKLKSLDLSWAQIKDISVLKGLGNLQALSLSYTNMSDISALQDLSNLQALDLSNTNMSNILALQGLSKLQVLDLSDTQVSDISALQGLSKLQSLDLSDTQVSDLSALQDLRELRALSLSNTQVSTIEAWLIELPQLRELNLSGSPIRHLPYEIINQSRSNCLQDLKNWFHDLAAGSVRNKEIKVMFVGNGRVGKSCILERITVGTYTRNKLSTHAIELKTWPVEDRDSDGMILNLWDFGGQDIYLGTHRIFMQSRALYLLIWDWEAESQQHRAAEEPDAEGYVHKNQPLLHWMDYIRSLSKQSPVMVVQNKVDIHKNKQAPARQVMDKNGWVLDYFAVSAETGRGISDLKQGILEAARSMPEWGMQIPASWQKVRTAIRERTTQEKDISQDAFEAICAQAEVRKISQASLLRYLHDTGVLFYQKGLFHNRIILDQQWAIEAVYTLFRRDKMFWHLLHRGDGQFSFEELDLFWRGEKGFDTEQSKVALSFMLSCEICFQLNPKQSNDKNKAVYVAPQLLPEQRPDKVHTFWQNLSGGLTLRFDYEYLHEAFVHRFIVRAGHLAQPHHLWRRGIWFIWEQTSALIFAREHGEAESAGGFIQIQVRGPRQAELLHLIRKEFENIHPAEINHSTKIVLDAGTLLDFSELKKYRQNQLSEILAPDGSSVDPKAFDDFFFDPEKIAAHSHKTAVEKEKSMRDLQPSPPLLPDQKQAWKVRVGDGKGVEVLKELMSFSDDNQVYLFHARYERLKKQTHDGTRNAEGLNQEENSLIAAILELINQIEILP